MIYLCNLFNVVFINFYIYYNLFNFVSINLYIYFWNNIYIILQSADVTLRLCNQCLYVMLRECATFYTYVRIGTIYALKIVVLEWGITELSEFPNE